MTPRLLDLFCGAGGAADGYAQAGFTVVGVDKHPQPEYPYEFHQADALTYPLEGFDVIHASPPCQHYSSATKAHGTHLDHPDLFGAVRDRLVGSGVPWVIENVEGAPVQAALKLCGSHFGLEVQRHRWFETSHLMLNPHQCRHTGRSLTVTGHTPQWWAQGERISAPKQAVLDAMGIARPMTFRGVAQAIPPAFTAWIGAELLFILSSEDTWVGGVA